MLRAMARATALLVLLCGTHAAASDKAPFADLIDIDGKPVTTEADVGIGKWQLVMLWATDCHICGEMKPLMSAFHDKHKKHRRRSLWCCSGWREEPSSC